MVDDAVADEPDGRAPFDRVDHGPVHVEGLVADLRELADDVESPDHRAELGRLTELLGLASARGVIDSRVRRLDRRDAAEALVGSVVFASPLLVEGGLFDIAAHLLSVRAAGVPVYLACNVVVVVLMTYALVEWTGRDRRDSHRFGGVLPARVLMVLVVSFVTTAALMTVWGRVGDWQAPGDALARISVLWTVGAIGGALGDLVGGGTPPPAGPVAGTDGVVASSRPIDADPSRGELVTEIDDRFDSVHATLDDEASRRELRRIEARATHAATTDLFGDRISKYTSRDIAEAFVGSVVFAIPLLVEDGVFAVAEYFLAVRLGGFPVSFLANAAFVVVMIAAICYWTGPQDVRVTRPLFGYVPRRLVGIAVVSFATTAALATLWGRVGGWDDPVVAVARVSVIWSVAAFGAALGDILPGQSSGADVNDHLSDLGERLADSVVDRE